MEIVKKKDVYSLKKIDIVEKRIRESIYEIRFEIDVCIILLQYLKWMERILSKLLREIYVCILYLVFIFWMCRRYVVIFFFF